MGPLLSRPNSPKRRVSDAEENYKAQVKPFRKNFPEWLAVLRLDVIYTPLRNLQIQGNP
jgi:hypothetical protein